MVAQNYISASELDIDRFTTGSVSGVTISPTKPGQVLIACATGLGPVTGGDNIASPGFNFEANGVNAQIIVDGVSITPTYVGRAPGLAGTDQGTGCTHIAHLYRCRSPVTSMRTEAARRRNPVATSDFLHERRRCYGRTGTYLCEEGVAYYRKTAQRVRLIFSAYLLDPGNRNMLWRVRLISARYRDRRPLA